MPPVTALALYTRLGIVSNHKKKRGLEERKDLQVVEPEPGFSGHETKIGPCARIRSKSEIDFWAV